MPNLPMRQSIALPQLSGYRVPCAAIGREECRICRTPQTVLVNPVLRWHNNSLRTSQINFHLWVSSRPTSPNKELMRRFPFSLKTLPITHYPSHIAHRITNHDIRPRHFTRIRDSVFDFNTPPKTTLPSKRTQKRHPEGARHYACSRNHHNHHRGEKMRFC